MPRSEAGLVEQLQNQKQKDLALAEQPLVMVASAQAVPLLQPYVSSQQISGMVSGLAEAARYDSGAYSCKCARIGTRLGLDWRWLIDRDWQSGVCLRDFVPAERSSMRVTDVHRTPSLHWLD